MAQNCKKQILLQVEISIVFKKTHTVNVSNKQKYESNYIGVYFYLTSEVSTSRFLCIVYNTNIYFCV